MSIAVPTDELAEAVAGFTFAYLVTIGEDGRPHVIAVAPVVTAEGVVVHDLGRRTLANLAARPEATLVWPPPSIDAHSLIVDGTGTLSGESLVITPSRAVLHRPAPAPASTHPTQGSVQNPGSGCGADCIEIGEPSS